MTCHISVNAATCSVCKTWVIPPALTLMSLGGVLGMTEAQIRVACVHQVEGDPQPDQHGNMRITPVSYCAACCPVCRPRPQTPAPSR